MNMKIVLKNFKNQQLIFRLLNQLKNKPQYRFIYRTLIKNNSEQNNWHRNIFRNTFLLTSTLSFLFFSHRIIIKEATCRTNNSNNKRIRPNTSKELELFAAIRQNDCKKVENLLKENSDLYVNTRHSLGWTPLQLAAVLGHAKIVEQLLKAGADPDAIDEFSNAGQIAYENRLNYYEVRNIREFEFCNLLANNVSFLGTTALHYACLVSSLETIKVLLSYNANPNLENEFGHKAIDYLDDDNPEMTKIIPIMQKYCQDYKEYIEKIKIEKRRKFPLEQRLKEVIVGQDGAIATVAAAIRRKENGWVDSEHPLVFLFLGSSGIGKTELAKQVARYLHGDHSSSKKGFIRVDMSEYQEKHEVSKFIGSPPGYVGHEEGGQLTKALRDCPNAVVLFDEIEKAHSDVLTIMLQLFDEGRLTDGKGKTIECKDAIFIMTSNLASEEIAEYGIKLRRESDELTKAQYSGKMVNENETENLAKVFVSRYFKDKIIRPILKRHFKRDEFLGRINEMVYFLPFSRSELHKLVLRELDLWAKLANERHKITLTWDSNVIGILANGYDVHYGARSIKYEVERRVVNKLANAYENGMMSSGAKIHIVVSNDGEDYKLGKVETNQQATSNNSSKDSISTEIKNSDDNVETKLKLLIENPPECKKSKLFF